MKIAERLYTQGLISYPRTETNIFPKSMNLANIVQQQTNDNHWGGKVVSAFICTQLHCEQNLY